MATLTWQSPDGRSLLFEVRAPETVLGRHPTSAIRIDSTYVSKRHAAIRLGPSGWTIADLGSSNGTRVNGRPVRTADLTDGDTIELGSERLVFRAEVVPQRGSSGSRTRGLALAGGGLAVALGLVITAGLLVTPREQAAPAAGRAAGAAVDSPAPGSSPDAGVAPPASPGAVPGPAGSPAAPGSSDALGTAPSPAPSPSETAAPAGLPLEPGPPAQAPAPQGGEPAPAVSAPSPAAGGDTRVQYDAAMAHLRGGRLVEARRLLNEALALNPSDALAKQRLQEVNAAIEERVEKHFASAQRAFTYLRFRDAIVEWEQVMAMTEPGDARHQQAADGVARARARLEQR